MSLPASPDESRQIERLVQFIHSLRVVLFVFGVAMVAGGVALKSPRHAVNGLVVIAYFAAICRARRLAENRRLVLAAEIVAYGALVVVLVSGLLFPYSVATTCISGLVAVAIAIPYLEGARLRWFLLASYAVVVAIVATGFHSEPGTKLPMWIEFPTVVENGAAATYLLLFLL